MVPPTLNKMINTGTGTEALNRFVGMVFEYVKTSHPSRLRLYFYCKKYAKTIKPWQMDTLLSVLIAKRLISFRNGKYF